MRSSYYFASPLVSIAWVLGAAVVVSVVSVAILVRRGVEAVGLSDSLGRPTVVGSLSHTSPCPGYRKPSGPVRHRHELGIGIALGVRVSEVHGHV